MATNKIVSINVPAFFTMLARKRKGLLLCVCITAVVAIVYAFSIPRIYKSSVVLAPESSSTSGLSSFSSLADMVGINLDFAASGDALYPDVYPDLIGSNDFLVSLFDCRVKSLKGDIDTTYYAYIKDMQKASWCLYPLRLVGKLLSGSKSSGAEGDGDHAPNPFMLTKDEDEVAKAISSRIQCAVDKKTSVITIEVTDQDPLIAAEMTEVVRKQLQVFITNYRTNKARSDMEYIKGLHDDAFKEYEVARREYASFSDSYQALSLPSYMIKKDELEGEMQLKFAAYRQLSEQLQITQAKVLERTPAFTIVKMASVPLKHSNTSKIVILFLFEFFVVGGYVLLLCYRNRKDIFTFSWQQK